MGAYILRRLLLIIPTMLGIMALSFTIIQFAPGGPIEKIIADLNGQGSSATDRISGGGGDLAQGGGQGNEGGGEGSIKYRGSQGIDPEFIAELEKQFGFDKPPLERFGKMVWDYARFDFGESFYRDTSVIDLIKEKNARFDLAGHLDLVFILWHINSARHQKGGGRRVGI